MVIFGKHSLKWECDQGHMWMATYDNVTTKLSWCPECSGTKLLSIAEMHSIAQSRGGKCLSSKYVNNRHKLLWKCSCGYEWMATPFHVKKGTWCSRCTKQVRPTIDDMRLLAKKRGGECLSEVYINAHTSLLWKCNREHQWKASPTNVKQGQWCKLCRKRDGNCPKS